MRGYERKFQWDVSVPARSEVSVRKGLLMIIVFLEAGIVDGRLGVEGGLAGNAVIGDGGGVIGP